MFNNNIKHILHQ